MSCHAILCKHPHCGHPCNVVRRALTPSRSSLSRGCIEYGRSPSCRRLSSQIIFHRIEDREDAVQNSFSREVELPWFALKVRTRSEPVAVSALRNRGYDPFCPTYPERRPCKDRVKVIDNAIFPGYLFCQFDIRHKVSVISSHSVEYLVAVGGIPSEIPEKEICNIRRAVEAGARPTPYFEVGQRVRVEFGSLAGVEGILLRCSSGNRLIISIDLLQRSVSLEVSREQVRAL